VLRLLESSGWHYDLLFGCALFGALCLGAAGLAAARWRSWRTGSGVLAVAVAVWLVLGLLVFDVMRTVHARYLDAMAPAVALAVGCGAATLAGLYGGRGGLAPLGLRRLALGTAAIAAITVYTFRFPPASVGLSVVMLLFAAAGAALLARAGVAWAPRARWLLAGLLVAVALVFPAHESLRLVRDHADDSAGLGTLDTGSISALAAASPLRSTTLAVDEPLALAPLIARDLQPILPLTSFAGRPLTSLATLRAAVAAGRVRYGLVVRARCAAVDRRAACTPAARWIRTAGTPLALPGLSGHERLYRLGSQS
jgi:4-amino-4-deoxy-L-arabinose transferase-like glycosyltransferase